MAHNAKEWDLLVVLPNLSLKPTLRFRGTRFAICSLSDWRVKKCLRDEPANRIGRRLARRYRGVWGENYTPSVLIARKSPETSHDAQDLRDFRNACAMSTVTFGAARTLTGSQWLATWSDVFCLGRFVPGKTGVLSLDGSSGGWRDSDDIKKFRGTSSEVVDAPQHFSIAFDRVLFRRLEEALMGKATLNPLQRERLFRSLAVAFHAARYPSDGLTVAFDLGTRVALWVSAFEALLNSTTADITKSHVLRFFDSLAWHQAALAPIRYSERNRNQKRVGRTCYAGALYQRLYRARNLFLHGSSVDSGVLAFRRRPLLRIAPVLYGLALHQYLRDATKPPDDVDDYFFGQGVLEEALIASKKRPSKSGQ